MCSYNSWNSGGYVLYEICTKSRIWDLQLMHLAWIITWNINFACWLEMCKYIHGIQDVKSNHGPPGTLTSNFFERSTKNWTLKYFPQSPDSWCLHEAFKTLHWLQNELNLGQWHIDNQDQDCFHNFTFGLQPNWLISGDWVWSDNSG